MGSTRCLLVVGPALMALASLGCEKYELHEDKAGRIVRLNKMSGDVLLIEGDRVIRPRTPEELQAEGAQLALAKTWPRITIQVAGKPTTGLRTAWRDDTLYYDFSLAPETPEIMKAKLDPQGKFSVLLLDENNFPVKTITVAIFDMTRTVGQDAKTLGLSGGGSLPMTANDYRHISAWNVVWHFW